MSETITAVLRGDRRKTPATIVLRELTLAELKDSAASSAFGTPRFNLYSLDRFGKAANVRCNGKLKLWKRDTCRAELPCKFGLYEYFTVVWAGGEYFLNGPLYVEVTTGEGAV